MNEENGFEQNIPYTDAPVQPEPGPYQAPQNTGFNGFPRTEVPPVFTQPQPMPVSPRKSKAPLIIACAAAALILTVVALYFGRGLLTGKSGGAAEAIIITAQIDEDGAAHIPMMDGTVITINDEVENAYVTKDRKNLVVLLEDGMLYHKGVKSSEKKIVADNAESLSTIRDDGYFYKDDEDILHRVLFKDSSDVELGKDMAFTSAADTMSVLFSDTKGNVFTLAPDSTEPVKVGTYSYQIRLNAISNDGTIAVWTEKDEDNNCTIVLNEKEESTVLGKVTSKYYDTSVTFTKDQKLMVVCNTSGESLWIKQPGKEEVKANLGSTLGSSTIYAAAGDLSRRTAAEVKELYVLVDASSGDNLYCITLDGDRERVLSKVDKLRITNGCAIYTEKGGDMYYAKLKGADIDEGTKIASDVDEITVSNNGNYIYYMRECEDNAGKLYCYKLGEKEPKRVSQNAACISLISYGLYNISESGDTVYYLKDAELVDGLITMSGTLMKWDYSKGESERIAGDVISRSQKSGLRNSVINPKAFVYERYSSGSGGKTLLVDVSFYNGKESTRLYTDVKH